MGQYGSRMERKHTNNLQQGVEPDKLMEVSLGGLSKQDNNFELY